VLIDPGTYTYVGDPKWRDWFRGSAAHNTVRIDGLDQATPAGPFRWHDKPEVEVLEWWSSAERDLLVAACRYRGFEHRRRIEREGEKLLINDTVEGPPGEHLIEQFWHFGVAEAVTIPDGDSREAIESWRSPIFGQKVPSPALRVSRRTALPAHFSAVIDAPAVAALRIEQCPPVWPASTPE
jgi:hypothetical protein